MSDALADRTVIPPITPCDPNPKGVLMGARMWLAHLVHGVPVMPEVKGLSDDRAISTRNAAKGKTGTRSRKDLHGATWTALSCRMYNLSVGG